MCRVIKFRAWIEEEERFSMIDQIKLFESVVYVYDSYEEYDYQIDPEHLQQFTGLIDKNGKHIYEGDIILDHNGFGIVEYKSKYAGFRVNYKNGRCKWFYDYILKGERESIEIVGNVFESKNLSKFFKWDDNLIKR